MKGGRILGDNKITSDMGIPLQYVSYRYPFVENRNNVKLKGAKVQNQKVGYTNLTNKKFSRRTNYFTNTRPDGMPISLGILVSPKILPSHFVPV